MNEYIHMYTYTFLVIGKETLDIILISDYQDNRLMLQMLSINSMAFPNTEFIIKKI